ncbi:MAG: prolipoprotein diacylglyceryl transferase [Anaerolineales bacterium]|nr:prolipoprotein diacylglyceryl transferase [Anaerolineales bacterium]
MYPYLYRTPWFFIYSYTAVFTLGILIGMGLTARLNRTSQIVGWLDGWLVAMGAAVLGGRLGFVLPSFDYYQERPFDLGLWQGGLNYHAALAAGFLALWGWCRWQKRPFLPTLNLFAPALALITAFGWAACWFEGCAYGATTTLGPFAADLPDNFGVFAVRYQTQWISAGWSIVIFAVALWQWQRGNRQYLFAVTLFGLSLGHVGVSLLRGDPVPTIAAIRLDTLFDTLLILFSLILLQYLQKTQQRNITSRQ